MQQPIMRRATYTLTQSRHLLKHQPVSCRAYPQCILCVSFTKEPSTLHVYWISHQFIWVLHPTCVFPQATLRCHVALRLTSAHIHVWITHRRNADGTNLGWITRFPFSVWGWLLRCPQEVYQPSGDLNQIRSALIWLTIKLNHRHRLHTKHHNTDWQCFMNLHLFSGMSAV